MYAKIIAAVFFITSFFAATGMIAAQAADGVVAAGHCNEAGFNDVLVAVDGSGGGTITFNCGTATITFTSYKQISHAVVIDGGGAITFDGGNTTPFFQIFASASVTFRRITLQHGVKTGLYAIENFGALTFDRAQVLDNVSAGAAVMNHGALVVSMSTFLRNRSTSGSEDGGAIHHQDGSARVDRSTFNGNSTVRSGGAIYSAAALKITNSTFVAGIASSGGGAVFQSGPGEAKLIHVTIVGNVATYGAGVANDAGDGGNAMILSRSILSKNTGGNCSGTLASDGYNLSDDTYCGSAFIANGDSNGINLTMEQLADNGGTTQTMPPAGGNPAIDHIPRAACALAVDQRGGGRPFGGGCDSGAVEVGATLDSIFPDGFE